MRIFGKSGIIRKQEVAFARKLLAWKYESDGSAIPDSASLFAKAENVVDEAHRIVKKRGGRTMEILKDLIKDNKK